MFAGAAFMVALSVANVIAGNASVIEMALYAAPFLAIVGLLLSGRYVAEERILAVYRSQPTAAPPQGRAALAEHRRTALQRRYRARAVVPARTTRPRRRLT